MHKQIKFIYALLIIAIISGGVTMWILGEANKDYVAILEPNNQSNIWSGSWTRDESTYEDSGHIKISSVIENSFEFDLLSLKESNLNNELVASTGDISSRTMDIVPKAIIESNSMAIYKTTDTIDGVKCEIVFNLTGKDLMIITDRGCDSFKGQGVYFDGVYKKDLK